MPVTKRRPNQESSQHQKFVEGLRAELRQETLHGPSIYEDEQRDGYKHITVIWDAWEDIAPEERGRIIMDAYEKEWPKEELLKITVALGLTQQEASRLGIDLSKPLP
jgi:hypothetical protein